MLNSEHQLLRRLKANDRAAFETVVERHYQPIFRQLWRLSGDAEAAADLTQETFVQAWRSLPTFEGRSALRTWLCAIAIRVWRRWQRQGSRVDSIPLDDMAETLPDEGRGPAEQFGARELWDEVQTALFQLSPDYREAVVLFYMEGLKYREIAEVLGIPLGTVKSRLHAGLQRLRSQLEGSVTDEPLRCL